MLTVYIDFKSAGSWLALEPTVELAERLSLEIDWRPFSTAPRDLPDRGANTDVIESHRAAREHACRAMDIKYAALRGLNLTFPHKEMPTALALGALAEMSGSKLGFLRAAFNAYWLHGKSLDDPAVVAQLLKRTESSHSGDFSCTREAFETAQSDAERAGIVEAPAFVIEGQTFVGRQHLPWIAEIAENG